MTEELHRALNEAHKVFACYGVPDYLGLGGSFQLRDLTMENWEQLNEQHDMGVLMFSDGGEMLRYFLPRWLEWLADDTVWFRTSRWELGDLSFRLSRANWRAWPKEEVAALQAVFAAWTRQEIAKNNGAPSSSWQHQIAQGEGETMGLAGFSAYSDLLRFLAELGEAPLYLELWLDTNLPQLARWLWIEDLREFKAERAWVTSSRLEGELEAAFFANPDGPDAELFSRSVELVRSLRAG